MFAFEGGRIIIENKILMWNVGVLKVVKYPLSILEMFQRANYIEKIRLLLRIL